MRIAFYNHTSAISGAEISMLLTAQNLIKAHPIIFAPEGELLQRARNNGLEVRDIPSYRARLTKNPIRLLKDVTGMLWAGWRLAGVLKKEKVDLIHANSIRAGIMAALFIWFHRIPIVWHLRDMPPQGIFGKLIKKVASLTTRSFIGISNSVLENFQHPSLKGRLHLIHNGVELRHFSPADRDRIHSKIREELKTPSGSKVLTIIGQIAPWKRQEDAIKAAAQLIAEGEDVYLWVVGEAKFRIENERYLEMTKQLAEKLNIKERVIFTGFREDVLEICCAADLLLLCSDNEPFGRVIIEAMSQGTPVIGTESGGVPEIIKHDECGYMYPVGNVSLLVDYINKVLKNKEVWSRLSDTAKLRAETDFSIIKTAQKVEQLYDSILSSSIPGHSDVQHAKEMA